MPNRTADHEKRGIVPTTIKVLSAGAVEPGLVKVIEAFRRETGDEVIVSFATAPSIRKRLREGDTVEVVIAPPDVLDELVNAGKAQATEGVIVVLAPLAS